MDPSEQRVIDDVQQHGWHAVCIEADDEGPGFNYSIGLQQNLDHPEIIMFGLDRGLMHDVMWDAVRDIRGGRRFDTSGHYEGLLEGYACATRPVHVDRHTEYLGYAMWYMRHLGRIGQLEAVQLFWPSNTGLFPWEAGCHEEVIQRQPLLYLASDADGT